MMAEAVSAMRWPALVLAVVVLGLLAGTAEELFFRGFVQTRLRQRWGPRWAVAVTALVFGAFHCDPWHSPTAAILGVYLGWLAERTGSLRPSIVAHVVNNALYVPMVVFGPKDLPVGVHAGLMAASTSLAALAVAIVARAYPPAAARPEPRPDPEALPAAPPAASME
jgi:membrane protease YdiL (CAAX protease family)